MPSVRDIKRRIRSVKSTQQITKAMKMVSAAKLRRTQTATVSSRPYAHKLEEVLERIVASAGETKHPLMLERPVQSVAIILVTADRGLAGGYNANVIRKGLLEAARFGDTEVSFFAVGRKGRDFLRRRNKKIDVEIIGVKDVPTFMEAQNIAQKAVDGFLGGTYDAVYVVYQEFITAVQQRPVIKQLLPIPYEKEEKEEVEYLYEPGPQDVLGILLPKYINNTVYHILMETKASEHGARMAAMGSATDNASEMIDKLTLSYNRSRQAAITREISEIVGGANALQG
ncbi:MAG TPA: ATP synthase F1 subunit gamma [Peptococcaceae bacterium]|jgi:F-type H+-transporting ATPase subunit gamma|nr:ATP synthase F1 subunit gamma [Clostridia bacterium]HOB81727.1 ATP synthase F1 subunit gamma [Peptococcaceae bacterium]HPZ71594.1 ATP synthase F1 subunit gamma [Peptococcaceae bacterium]HQD54637.1 ATP synthase F1 subunit gamma [Peptococcaceae bacterium]